MFARETHPLDAGLGVGYPKGRAGAQYQPIDMLEGKLSQPPWQAVLRGAHRGVVPQDLDRVCFPGQVLV